MIIFTNPKIRDEIAFVFGGACQCAGIVTGLTFFNI